MKPARWKTKNRGKLSALLPEQPKPAQPIMTMISPVLSLLLG